MALSIRSVRSRKWPNLCPLMSLLSEAIASGWNGSTLNQRRCNDGLGLDLGVGHGMAPCPRLQPRRGGWLASSSRGSLGVARQAAKALTPANPSFAVGSRPQGVH